MSVVKKFWNFIDNGRDAELQLFGTISTEEDWWRGDCVTYKNFINELNALGKKDNINVLIQSRGGDVFAANAIYNALISNGAKITATVIGICASAATIVLQAAEVRRIAKNGIVMIHNPQTSLSGNYEAGELIKMAEAANKVKESIKIVYRERLKKTDEEIDQLMDETTWYVGQEAVDNGFCDDVIDEDIQDNIITNIGEYNFQNYIDTLPDNIKKKVQSLSKKEKFFDGQRKGNYNMERARIENVAQLRSAYPTLVKKITDEAIRVEHERLKAIDEISAGVSNDVLMKAKYDEPISAAELALVQLKVNNRTGQRMMTEFIDDIKNSNTGAVGTIPDFGDRYMSESGKEKINGFANALRNDKRREKK